MSNVPDHLPKWNFNNSYVTLPDKLFSLVKPSPVSKPELLIINEDLAQYLGLDFSKTKRTILAELFAGNRLPKGSEPLAQAYAGHQFGHFTMLGDGRAILLGEQITTSGNRVDIQLKGSGRTPYSRGGDGRATLYSMLREYVISEAIHNLGIPTSRSLAVAITGDPVYREEIHRGAVLMRVASSHIRVGTFEYAIRFLGQDYLRKLLNYTVDRHYPELSEKSNSEKALGLLEKVSERQADLVVEWIRTGFIHGVMNTDNTGIAGETFDYGPCSFMNGYDPNTVFSSIDANGRYRFGNQPLVMQWNMAVFAGTLVREMSDDIEEAKEMAQGVVNSFSELFSTKWENMMARKIGFPQSDGKIKSLFDKLLKWMEIHEADYTNTFRALTLAEIPEDSIFNHSELNQWKKEWKTLLNECGISFDEAVKRMNETNPAFIPRNHLVEDALKKASEQKDLSAFNSLLKELENPYPQKIEFKNLQTVPETFDATYKTFCGT